MPITKKQNWTCRLVQLISLSQYTLPWSEYNGHAGENLTKVVIITWVDSPHGWCVFFLTHPRYPMAKEIIRNYNPGQSFN
jgi:hypothetical protein